MQSFTTQSHARNYQGNVVLPTTRSPKKGHKMMGFAASVMVLAVAVMGGLWGATAVHNHQLKQQVATVSTNIEEDDPTVYPTMTLEEYPEEPVVDVEVRRTQPLHKKRPLRALMVDDIKSDYSVQVIHNN